MFPNAPPGIIPPPDMLASAMRFYLDQERRQKARVVANRFLMALSFWSPMAEMNQGPGVLETKGVA